MLVHRVKVQKIASENTTAAEVADGQLTIGHLTSFTRKNSLIKVEP